VIDILQRLGVPLVLLAAIIGVTVAIDRLGNDELPPVAAGDAPSDNDALETPVLSIRRAPSLLTSPRANAELSSALADWVTTLPATSCFVVAAGGDVIFEHQPSLPVAPASNMKLLTAYAALESLGPDFRFVTRVMAETEPDADGLIEADLYVIGGGDPVLMSPEYVAVLPPADNKTFTSIADLTDQTLAANVATIYGGVVVDESRYDEQRSVDGWPASYASQQAGALSAAMLDQGMVGWRDGYASQVGVAEPPLLPRASEPAIEFGTNFDDMLEATVLISRAPRKAAPDELDLDALVELASISSPPLTDIVAQMLVNSDNTTAEMIVKELAVANGQTGHTDSGLLALRSTMATAGLDDPDFLPLDGSGLNADSTLTCDLVRRVLDDPEHKTDLRAGLAVAGESGTLADSFIGTKFEGRLRAKTGFLSSVSALSGYYTTDRGVEVTFAMIVNSEEPIGPENIVAWQANLPDLLAPYPIGPPLSQLGPKGVIVGQAQG